MRFNPDARIDASRIDATGGAAGGGRLPIPMPRSGGGRIGIVLMLLGLLYRWWQSRRTPGAA